MAFLIQTELLELQTAVRRITAKVKTVICKQTPNHGSYFAYARLIARVTLNLLCQFFPLFI